MGVIIGIDEAGRGSLAGPIVGAAILSSGEPKQLAILSQVRDSKQLSSKKREMLYDQIINNFIWSVSVITNKEIDKHGIQQANYKVVYDSANKLGKIRGSFTILADYIGGGKRVLPYMNFFTKGDQRFSEIAAASIIAKVYRDKLMEEADSIYTKYNFKQHKGYGTAEHWMHIHERGVCDIHRLTFVK